MIVGRSPDVTFSSNWGSKAGHLAGKSCSPMIANASLSWARTMGGVLSMRFIIWPLIWSCALFMSLNMPAKMPATATAPDSALPSPSSPQPYLFCLTNTNFIICGGCLLKAREVVCTMCAPCHTRRRVVTYPVKLHKVLEIHRSGLPQLYW